MMTILRSSNRHNHSGYIVFNTMAMYTMYIVIRDALKPADQTESEAVTGAFGIGSCSGSAILISTKTFCHLRPAALLSQNKFSCRSDYMHSGWSTGLFVLRSWSAAWICGKFMPQSVCQTYLCAGGGRAIRHTHTHIIHGCKTFTTNSYIRF